MYKMKADGVVFYDPSSNDMSLQVLSPKAKFELNKADALEFTMLPGNVAYDSLQKMKTIITLEDDGEVIFRGRVLGTTTDLYNQKEVYCEGELGYLLDSLVRPYNFEGKASDLFRQLVAEHNSQVDSFKQFQVGTITAVTDEDETKTESEAYTSTYAEIRQMLVTKFGGYLRVRMSGGVRYLDYLDEYNEGEGAPINFGENLVDIEDKYEAGDVFSVLVPLGGYNTKHKDAITIAEVNGGRDYIESPSAVAKYGRIVKTYKWEELTDPQEILEKGQEHIAKMEEERTLVIKAYDLHDLGQGNRIRLGSNVYLGSSPHGLDGVDICSKLELDIEQPDQSEYTFGIPPETLTDNNASRVKKAEEGMDKLREWLTVTDEELRLSKQHIADNGNKISNVMIELDAVNATILLKADQTVVSDLETRVSNAEILIDGANAAIDLKADRTIVSDLETRMSAAEILIDGANAAIELKAAQKTVDELSARLSQAEIDIDGANAQINLKASKATVDALGERVSSAEIKIDGANSSIELLAEEIRLAGYVTADAFETETLKVVEGATLASLKTGAFNCSGRATVNEIWATGGVITNLNVPNIIIAGTSFDPADYATKEWVEDQGYLKSANLSNYATQSWVIERNYTTASDVAQTLDGYVMQGELDGYATEAWVRENFSKASATYKPTVIERYGSVSGTSIPVRALNESGTVLLTGTVAAGDVYTTGYNNAKVNDLTIGTPSYYASSKFFTFPVTAIANDGTTKQEYFGLDATAAYDSGYADGQAAGGSSTPDIMLVWTVGDSVNEYTVMAVDRNTGAVLATTTNDFTSIYNKGWNACRDACTLATSVYTIKEYAPGTLYMKITSGGQTYYSSVGSDWVRTSAATAYNRPAAKS